MKIFNTILVAILSVSLAFGCTETSVPTRPPQPNTPAANQSGGEETPTQEQTELAPLEQVPAPDINRTSGQNGERQTYLSMGATAPWAGVLLNPQAVAFVISQVEGYRLRTQAALHLQRESDWNRLRLEVGRLQIRLNTQRRESEVVVQGLQREVQRLTQIHENYIQQQTGGFWNSDIGQVIKYGLIILCVSALGGVVGYIIGAAQ